MKKVLYLLTLPVFALALSCSCDRSAAADDERLPSITGEDNDKEVIYEKDESSYRIVSYNVGAFSKYMTNSTSVVAAMMKEIEADAMVLNELDRNNGRHDTDQLADFAKEMDWDCYYAKAMDYRNGEYGNGAAWSKDLDVVSKSVIALPKQTGSEDRCCVVIEFSDFVLAGTHLDVGTEDDRVRGVQTITRELMEKYGEGDKPVFVCGDMNAEPSSETVKEFKKNWTQLTPAKSTHSSQNPTKCIDYVFALKDVGSYEVTASDVLTSFKSGSVKQASDHLPVYVDVTIK